MSEVEPLRLGTEREWGTTTCSFGVSGPECYQPAVRHVLWLPDVHTSNACAEHILYLREHAGDLAYEEHTFAGDCGMPGALWRHPYEDEDEGHCFFPSVDDASLLAEEPIPALATPAPSSSPVPPTPGGGGE